MGVVYGVPTHAEPTLEVLVWFGTTGIIFGQDLGACVDYLPFFVHVIFTHVKRRVVLKKDEN